VEEWTGARGGDAGERSGVVEAAMGAGAEGRVGDDGRGAWAAAAARRPENPGLPLPEVISPSIYALLLLVGIRVSVSAASSQ
jgi:hypothetical protein